MIPSYNNKIDIPPLKPVDNKEAESYQRLESTINTLKEQVDYLMRENSRLKSDLDTIKYKINRS